MSIYTYTGINDKGKKIIGSVEAENEKMARAKLRKQGIYPTNFKVGGSLSAPKIGLTSQIDLNKYFQRVKVADVALFTRQMATLLSANVTLVDSLQALSEQTENEKLRNVISDMRQKVMEGQRLSDSMRPYQKIFSEMYINMVNAGENSGALDIVLSRLADFIEGQNRTRSRVIGAMVYPIIMGFVGIVVMGVIMTFMVPKMTALFKSQKMELPFSTELLIFISNMFSNYWYLILILIVFVVVFLQRWFKTEKGREFRDGMILKVPLFGRLIRMISISRFSRTLSTLLASGVPMLSSMDIVKNVISNVLIRSAVEVTRDSVKEGESIAEPLRRSGHFPPIVTHMIAVGEKTGSLEKMLERISDNYDFQVDTTISTMLSVLEPILILAMAGAISFVAVSILLPMLQMGDLGALGK